MEGVTKLTISPASLKNGLEYWLNSDIFQMRKRCCVVEAKATKDGGARLTIVPPDWKPPKSLSSTDDKR